MINCNGTLVSSLSEGDEATIHSLLHDYSVEENLRSSKGKILLWELHYFRIIAALRRQRFIIPMGFTMEYLKNEILRTLGQNHTKYENHLIYFKFIKSRTGVYFIISVDGIPSFTSHAEASFALDLYKEEWVPSGFFSNLSSTNQTLRQIAKAYALENGLEDCVLLNDHKNLVESTSGSIYLVQGNTILTPHLESGCQDFVIRSAFNQWIGKEQSEYSMTEQAINPFELQKSEEIILLSIENGAQNVTHYRKTTYLQKKVSSIFEKFLKQLD